MTQTNEIKKNDEFVNEKRIASTSEKNDVVFNLIVADKQFCELMNFMISIFSNESFLKFSASNSHFLCSTHVINLCLETSHFLHL